MVTCSSASTTSGGARSNGSSIMIIQKLKTSLAGLALFPLTHHKDGDEEGENKGTGNTSNDWCKNRFSTIASVLFTSVVAAAAAGEGGSPGGRSCRRRAAPSGSLSRVFGL